MHCATRAARLVDSNVTSSGSDNRNLLLIPYGSVRVIAYPRDLNSDRPT